MRAVIFDMDGTIVDNTSLHAEAFVVFSRRHGLPPIGPADRARLDGRRNSEVFADLFRRPVPRDEWLAYEAEKETLYRELSRGRLVPAAGLAALLEVLGKRGIAAALATSAPAGNVVHTLTEIGMTDAFTVIVRGDEVASGKPAPDVFIEAARRLGTGCRDCLVIEDAPVGILAAQAAGMPVAAVATSFPAAALAALTPPPDAILTTLAELISHRLLKSEWARAENFPPLRMEGF